MADFKILDNYHRDNKSIFSDSLSLRTYRAIRWIGRAEDSNNDGDIRFISYWIAFNAAYAKEIKSGESYSEVHNYKSFLEKIIDLDSEKVISKTIMSEFSNAVRVLLANKYIYQPFWEYVNGDDNFSNWEAKFNAKNKEVLSSIMMNDTPTALNTIFARLYTLRNQIMHGGSTWNSSVNRDQLRDANNILAKVMPQIVMIMMNNPSEFADRVNYMPMG